MIAYIVICLPGKMIAVRSPKSEILWRSERRIAQVVWRTTSTESCWVNGKGQEGPVILADEFIAANGDVLRIYKQ